MNEKIKTDWFVNGLLTVILVLLIGNFVSNHAAKSASAAGGGWETDGYMVNTCNAGERLILIDTVKQNIMIYRAQAGGAFGLTGARSFKYDVQLQDLEKIQHNGWTYLDARATYEASQK